MELEKVIKLIDAGYTKADIEKMLTPAAEETKPEPEPAPEPKPEEKKPDSEPVNAQMLKELQDLKKAVFAMNIMQSSQPDKTDSVDDILAKALKEG